MSSSPGVRATAPIQHGSAQIVYGAANWNTRVTGVTPSYLLVRDWRVVSGDCGGRTPNYDAVDVFRSLLVNGTSSGVEDGVGRDDRLHSTTTFPFLAAP